MNAALESTSPADVLRAHGRSRDAEDLPRSRRSIAVDQRPSATRRLIDVLRDSRASHASVADRFRHLIDAGADDLPLPGHGETLERWRALAAVAQEDLSLVKLYEAHVDALAILAEVGAHSIHTAGRRWAVWAAESPDARVTFTTAGDGMVLLDGIKPWCSGARTVTDALLTVWPAREGEPPSLAHLDLSTAGLSTAGVCIDDHRWRAIGMADSASADVVLRRARARLIGPAGAYLARPGFWHGGAGIAACWFGATCAAAMHLRRACAGAQAGAKVGAKAGEDTRVAITASLPFKLAALGRVCTRVDALAAQLREAAAWIDAHPRADAFVTASRVRLMADECARSVLDAVAQSLGPGPLCRDHQLARLIADLPVFIRQWHGDPDAAGLAQRMLDGATELGL